MWVGLGLKRDWDCGWDWQVIWKINSVGIEKLKNRRGAILCVNVNAKGKFLALGNNI